VIAEPSPLAGRVLWHLHRFGRTVFAVERPHPEGAELVVLLELKTTGQLETERSTIVRPDDDTTIEAEAEDVRQALLARGWKPAA
jgi:hypothetical protein